MAYVAMYQKFKLIRERNQLELQLIGMERKLERIGKNLSNKEKYYTGLFEKIRQQATNYKNQAKLGFQSIFGLGQGSVNPLNYGGTNGFVLSYVQQALASGKVQKIENGKLVDGYMEWQHDPEVYLNHVYTSNGIPQMQNEEGPVYETLENGKQIPVWADDISNDEKMAIDNLIRMGNMQYQQTQMTMNQALQNYDTNISIWQQSQEAQLQAEQDSVLGALQYEQTIMQIDKDYIETRLSTIEQLEKSYDEKAKKDIERSVPKFGLG